MTRDPELEVSVCIVTWNVAADLRACLQSLRAQEGSPAAEVIVVDNASTDDTVHMLEHEFPEVITIRNAGNRGFAAATNQALERARGRYLMMLNPDTVVPADALGRIVEVADDSPQAGIVAPRLVYPDGSLQYSCRRFPTITAAIFRNTLLGSLFPRARAAADYVMADWDHATVREVDWASGAAIAIRRQLYEQIGPLDEGFRWGSEDVDYCLRARQAGWGVLYTPEPVIVHAVGRSSDQAVVRSIITAHHSMYRLYSKHFARNPLSRLLVWIGIWLRASLLITTWWARRGLSLASAWLRRPFFRRLGGKS
jgi:GT2 family glycosyltransferase